MIKLTKEQADKLRELSPELAGSVLDVIAEIKQEVWEPEGGEYYAHDEGRVAFGPPTSDYRLHGSERKTESQADRLLRDREIYQRMHAFRDKFAPDYVVPPVGELACFVAINSSARWEACWHYQRVPTTIYMPGWLCEKLVGMLKDGTYTLLAERDDDLDAAIDAARSGNNG